MQEFVGLQSKYVKTFYRLLKQWRSTEQYIFNNIDDFREKMDVPKPYSNMRLMTKIIEPTVKEQKNWTSHLLTLNVNLCMLREASH